MKMVVTMFIQNMKLHLDTLKGLRPKSRDVVNSYEILHVYVFNMGGVYNCISDQAMSIQLYFCY